MEKVLSLVWIDLTGQMLVRFSLHIIF